MCCNRLTSLETTGRPGRGFAALALTGALMVTLACGHKAPPLPPPNLAPQTTEDIRVRQRGLEVLVDFAYPQVTVSGQTLDGIEVVELWHLVLPVPETLDPAATDETASPPTGLTPEEPATRPAAEVPAAVSEPPIYDEELWSGDDPASEATATGTATGEGEEPASSPEVELRADPREFAAGARLWATVRNPELQSKIVGDRIFLSQPLEETLADPPEVHNIGVRTFAVNGRPSRLSKHVVLIPRTPPAPPQELAATGAEDGVGLVWEAEGVDLVGFRIYRREIRNAGFDQAIGKTDAAARTYSDRTALFGHDYAYSITTVIQEAPLIESRLAEVVEIRHEDTFAPATPRSLVALSGAEGVRLIWEEGRAPDLAGYVVFRQERGTEFERITAEPITDNEFVDSGVSAGRSYTYVVRAIDSLGNLSSPSEPIDARP